MASVRVSAVPDRVVETGRHFPEKEEWQGTFLHKWLRVLGTTPS